MTPTLKGWLAAFRDCFTAPVWAHVLVLVAGAILAPGKRTVSQALRVMGLASNPGFGRYHEVLSRARWDSRTVARTLLKQVLDAFLPTGEVVIGVDDTIKRRWGPRIKARGIYRDPVRSSHGHFVKASGLLAVAHGHGADPLGKAALGTSIPHHPRPLRALEQRAQSVAQDGRRLGGAGQGSGRVAAGMPAEGRQAILQTRRWLPDRRLVVVAPASPPSS